MLSATGALIGANNTYPINGVRRLTSASKANDAPTVSEGIWQSDQTRNRCDTTEKYYRFTMPIISRAPDTIQPGFLPDARVRLYLVATAETSFFAHLAQLAGLGSSLSYGNLIAFPAPTAGTVRIVEPEEVNLSNLERGSYTDPNWDS